jgi:hypothetical protein
MIKSKKQENKDFIYEPAILIYLYNHQIKKHKKDIEELNDKIIAASGVYAQRAKNENNF